MTRTVSPQAPPSGQKVILFDIDHTLFDTQVFWDTKFKKYSLHKEVKDVLMDLKTIAHLGIFSEGEVDFQKKKLVTTGIFDFFEQGHTHIVSKNTKIDSMKTVLNDYHEKNTFFIDDRLDFLYAAKKYLPSLHTMWMKRGYHAEKQMPIDGFEPDVTVNNLREAAEFVKSH